MVFISYSRADMQVADIVRLGLATRGIDSWMDRVVGPGGDWMRQIEAALAKAADVVVVLSPALLSDERTVVRLEVELAVKLGKPLVPVTLPQFVWPEAGAGPSWIQSLRRFNAVPVSFDYQDAFIDKLVRHCSETSRGRHPWWKFWRRRVGAASLKL